MIVVPVVWSVYSHDINKGLVNSNLFALCHDTFVLRLYVQDPTHHHARDLGISLTALKQVCRKLGIVRWPYMRSSKIYSKHGGRLNASTGPNPTPAPIE